MKKCKYSFTIVLIGCLMIQLFTPLAQSEVSAAVPNPFTLSQTKSLSLARSREIKKIRSKIITKEVKYMESVRSLKEKMRALTSFRWSPLLNFKFPESPDLIDEFEFTYKPTQIQFEITSLKHQLVDEVHEVYRKASSLYIEIYSLQRSIAFEEGELEQLKRNLERNRARLLVGDASEADIKKMEKAVSSLEKKITNNKRSFETKKADLKDMVKLDVTSGYEFTNPYKEAQIGRDKLEYITDYTLANDHTFFQAKSDTQLALINLDTNYDLMRSQYGGDMNIIDKYVFTVKGGGELEDPDVFKMDYDQLLYDIDEPWQGSYRILFIRIPKEWFKGEIDGIRYVQDEPYALYTAILDYESARVDQDKAEKTLIKQINSGFESMVTARNTYLALLEEEETLKADYDQGLLQNYLGELPYDELVPLQDSYNSIQQDVLDALSSYTQELCTYDRLTCGAITNLLNGTDADIDSAIGGNSYLVDEEYEGAYYFIKNRVEDNIFELGIHIPSEFSIDITHFELWCDNVQIGAKTKVKDVITHLTLAKDNVESVMIRLYNEDEFVDECEIDPAVYSDELIITGGYRIEEIKNTTLGRYAVSANSTTGIAQLTFMPDREDIAFYSITDSSGRKLYSSSEFIPVKEVFSYLEIFASDMEKLMINCYGTDKGLLATGYFDTGNLLVKELE